MNKITITTSAGSNTVLDIDRITVAIEQKLPVGFERWTDDASEDHLKNHRVYKFWFGPRELRLFGEVGLEVYNAFLAGATKLTTKT